MIEVVQITSYESQDRGRSERENMGLFAVVLSLQHPNLISLNVRLI